MTADRAFSNEGGALELARTLCRAADAVVAAAADRRRLADHASRAGFSGPVAEEVLARIDDEERAAAEVAAVLRGEADRWAAAWAGAVGPAVVPGPPDYEPVVAVAGAWR